MKAYFAPLALALALVACQPGDTPANDTAGVEATDPLVNEPPAEDASPAVEAPPAAADPVPAPAETAPAAPSPAAPAANASAPQQTIGCAAEIGQAAAERLAKQCRNVSPATRPPCNVANSCAMMRAEIERSCSVTAGDGPPIEGCPRDPDNAAAARKVLETYYTAINARDYSTAWQLWDNNPQPLPAFSDGFAHTVRSAVSFGRPGRIEGAAGSAYVTIPVTVTAQLDSGQRQRFTGSYTLRRQNVERSQGWRIQSAKLRAG